MPMTGIEPVRVLARRILSPVRLPVPPHRHKWREKDSNLRRRNQQIYSLPPLATRESLQNVTKYIIPYLNILSTLIFIFYIYAVFRFSQTIICNLRRHLELLSAFASIYTPMSFTVLYCRSKGHIDRLQLGIIVPTSQKAIARHPP